MDILCQCMFMFMCKIFSTLLLYISLLSATNEINNVKEGVFLWKYNKSDINKQHVFQPRRVWYSDIWQTIYFSSMTHLGELNKAISRYKQIYIFYFYFFAKEWVLDMNECQQTKSQRNCTFPLYNLRTVVSFLAVV